MEDIREVVWSCDGEKYWDHMSSISSFSKCVGILGRMIFLYCE